FPGPGAEYAQRSIQAGVGHRQAGAGADQPLDVPVASAGLDHRVLADIQPGAVGPGQGAGQTVGVVTFATAHIQYDAGCLFTEQPVDLIADRLVMAAVEEGLAAAEHGRGVAGLAAVLVLYQQQVEVALAGLVVAVAIGTGPGAIRNLQRLVAMWA